MAQLVERFLEAALHLCHRLAGALIGFFKKRGAHLRHSGPKPFLVMEIFSSSNITTGLLENDPDSVK